jgi:REP-associated tyrosine transposase
MMRRCVLGFRLAPTPSNTNKREFAVEAFVPNACLQFRCLAQAPLQRHPIRVPDRPPRLHCVFQQYDPPLYFVTFNTHRHRKLLANASVQNELFHFAKKAEQHGIGLGRYVIMPDHIHLFVRGSLDFSLRQWVRMMKRRLSGAILAEPPHWQQGFFDHLIRHSESYAQKWEYVRQNPVRV